MRALLARLQQGRVFDRHAMHGRDAARFDMLEFAGHYPGRSLAALFNILKGDLSLTGPRARTPDEVAQDSGASMAERHAVRPGMISPFSMRRRVGIAHDAEAETDSEFVYTQTAGGSVTLLLRALLGRLITGDSKRPTPATLRFFDVDMANTTMDETLAWLTDRARARKRTLLAFVNPDCLNTAYINPDYLQVLQQASRVLPDGIGVNVGCRIKGVALRANLNGTDLFPRLCETLAETGQSIYLLGAQPEPGRGHGAGHAGALSELRVAGTQHGYFDSSEDAAVSSTSMPPAPTSCWWPWGHHARNCGLPARRTLAGAGPHGRRRPVRLLLRQYPAGTVVAARDRAGMGVAPAAGTRPHVETLPRRQPAVSLPCVARVPRPAQGRAPCPAAAQATRQPLRPNAQRFASASRRGHWRYAARITDVVKRLIDIVVSGALLLLLLPLFGLVALAIRLESPGPVFFRQVRVGCLGQTFTMWKFRSMYIDAEQRKASPRARERDAGRRALQDEAGPAHHRVGRVIRRLSIDELPQLWNVFKGDMSLVGPRPALPVEVSQYSLDDRGRLDTKPGITCTWQVTGRSDIPFDEQVMLDIDYIHEQSVRNDLKLLVKTVPAVISGRGAY